MAQDLLLAQLLSLRFSLEGGARFRHLHNPTVYAFLLARGGYGPADPFPDSCRFVSLESGRERYRAGDSYRLGLALLPNAQPDAPTWLRHLAGAPFRSSSSPGPLGPDTVLREVRDGLNGRQVQATSELSWLRLTDVDRAAKHLRGQHTLTIRFVSPLHIPRRPVRKRFLDGHHFAPPAFLNHVAKTIARDFPTLTPPAPLPRLRLLRNALVRAVAEGHHKHYFGALGEVTLGLDEALPAPWARALIIAGAVGVGRSTRMGQGRFTVDGAPLTPHWPPPPAPPHPHYRSLAAASSDASRH